MQRKSAKPSATDGRARPIDPAPDGTDLEETVSAPISSLRPGESPRLHGEDKAYIARLAELGTPMPPILVDRRTMRVIDGMHRLMAASLKGQETIEVRFFQGSAADVFLRGVKENTAHGLPLSLSDRREATMRIVSSHPQLSDRALGEIVGLSARTVATIRQRADMVAPSTRIWVRDRLPGFHRWPTATGRLAFLADRHRHVFDVQVYVRVAHTDRDLEFFTLAERLREWWGPGERECGSASCEALAHDLGDHLIGAGLTVSSVQVAVDGEGGAIADWPAT